MAYNRKSGLSSAVDKVYSKKVENAEQNHKTEGIPTVSMDDFPNAKSKTKKTAKPKPGPKEKKADNGDSSILGRDIAEIDSWDDHDKELIKYASMDFDSSGASYALTDMGENAARKELDAKYGEKRVGELVESYKRNRNAEIAKQAEESSRKAVDKYGAGLATVAAVPVNVFGGLAGTLDMVGQMINGRDERYKSADPNSGGMLASKWAEGVYGAVRNDIADGTDVEKVNAQNAEIERKSQEISSYLNGVANTTASGYGAMAQSGKFKGPGARQTTEKERELIASAYSGAVSAMESTFRTALSSLLGLPPKSEKAISLGIAGLQALQSAYSDASARGASPKRAAVYATGVAFGEVASELIPFGKAFDLWKGGGAKTFRSLAKTVGEIWGFDFAGEEVNNIAGNWWDAVVMQDMSHDSITIGDMIANGSTAEEAKEAISKQHWKEAKDTAVSTLASSIFGGGTGQILGSAMYGNNQQQETAEAQAEPVRTAEEIPVQPTVNEEPAVPVQQEAPVAPVAPEAPATPVAPVAPIAPAVPVTPVTPAAPETLVLSPIEQAYRPEEVRPAPVPTPTPTPTPASVPAPTPAPAPAPTQQQAEDITAEELADSLPDLTAEEITAFLESEAERKRLQDEASKLWEEDQRSGKKRPSRKTREAMKKAAEANSHSEIMQKLDDAFSEADLRTWENATDEDWAAVKRLDGERKLLDAIRSGRYQRSATAVQASTEQNAEAIPSAAPAQQEAQSETALEAAVEIVANGGTISNKTAEAILADPQSVEQMAEAGAEIPEGTMSQMRNAVKDFVQQQAETVAEDTGIANAEIVTEVAEAPVQEEAQPAETQEPTAESIMEDVGAEINAKSIEQEMDALSKQKDELLEAQRSGSITAEEMMQQSRNIDAQLDDLQERLFEITNDGRADEELAYAEEDEDVPDEESIPIQSEEAKTDEVEQQEQEEKDESPNQYDRDTDYVPLLKEGAHKSRKGDVRSVEVPLKDANGRVVSESVSNIYGSSMTSDDFITDIERLTAEGKTSHNVLSNKEALEQSAQRIAKKGIRQSVSDVVRTAESGKFSVEDVTDAINLYDYLNNDNNPESKQLAEDTFVAMTEMATQTGRATQIYSVFRRSNMADMFDRMSPDQKARVVERQIKSTVDKLVKNGTVKNGDYAIDNELMSDYKKSAEAYQKATTEEAKEKALKDMTDVETAIQMNVATQLNSTLKSQWNAWRYMAMLGNVKTQVRNVFGNALFMPYVEAKNLVATAGERLAKVPVEQRTKSVFNPATDGKMYSWAKADGESKDVQGMLSNTYKTGDADNDDISGNVQIFRGKLSFLEGPRKFIAKVPEAADMFFKSKHYARSLTGFLKARGHTMEDVNAGRISDDVLNEGRAYAVNEAMKATFNDTNAFSDFVAKFGRSKDDNPVAKIANILAEGVMPFRKTPANIVVRFAEYSPVGMIKTGYDAATKLRNGEVTASTVIDELSSNLVGTAAMGLGYALASGLFGGIRLVGSHVDDDEENQGHQEYALEIDLPGMDTPISYKIDWCAPANLPLFVGANLFESMEDSEEDTDISKITKFLDTSRNALEPMLSLSMLSSLNDLVGSAKWAEENGAVYSLLANMMTSYLSQGIPTVFRQIDNAIPKYKRTVYPTTNDPVTKDIQKGIANIPFIGNKYKTDYVDNFGRKVERGGILERLWDSAVNPGKVKTIGGDALDKEIERLNDAQESIDVLPDNLRRNISFDDKDGNPVNRLLTPQEYEKAKMSIGEIERDILAGVIETQAYSELTDEQKAKVFDGAYTYAKAKALGETLPEHPGVKTAWMKNLTEGSEGNGIVAHVIENSITNAFETATGSWKKGGNDTKQLVDVFDQVKAMSGGTLDKLDDGGQIGYAIETQKAGIPVHTAINLYKKYYMIGQKDISQGEQATQWAREVDTAAKAGEITRTQADMLKEHRKYWYSFPAESATYDKMVDAGIDYDDAVIVDKSIRDADHSETRTAITDGDKASAIANSGLSQEDIDKAMRAVLSEAQQKKLDYALENGADYETFGNALKGYYWTNSSAMRNAGYSKAQQKEQKILDIMDKAGVSRESAEAWYYVFERRER